MFADNEEPLPYECVNLPPSDEFVYNSRGEKLHVRSFWPDQSPPKALVIFLHGFASHCSRPIHTPIAKDINDNGYAYLCLDFHGHGHSEGLRAYLDNVDHLDDDVISLLFHLYRKKNGDESIYDADVCNLKSRAYGVPFYLMGHSLGGTVAIRLGIKLHSTCTYSFGVFFKGALLLSPLIKMNLPSAFRRHLFDWTVVALYPKSFVPSTLRRAPMRDETFTDKRYIDYIISDEFPENPEGLTYAGPVRFKTASTMLNLVHDMSSVVKEVTFPFLVFHDDRDVISLVEGIKELMRSSRTPQNRKEYKQVNRGKHDVITNRMLDVLPGIIEFLNAENVFMSV